MTWTSPTSQDGNLDTAGLFTSATEGAWDLRPAAGSPLVDAGDPALTDDDGSRADIGAHGGPGGAGL